MADSKTRRWIALALFVGLGVGCHRTGEARPDAGLRIVSLSPSTTEALYAVGAGAQLVGRSRFCNRPPEVLALPEVGGYADPSLEAILGLAPTLVIGARGPAGLSISAQLETRGVHTSFPSTETWDDVAKLLVQLGAQTGHAEEGVRAAERLRTETAEVEAELRGKPVPRVLLVFGISPIFVAGPGGFPDEMTRRAGAENVVTEGGAYPTLPGERVVSLDPDVVVNLAMDESAGAQRITPELPVWRELRAVREGRVAQVVDDAALRPGPRLAAGLRSLGRAIHDAGDEQARRRTGVVP